MFKIFKSSNPISLQKKYDKLMKEAYDLSKSNPTESQKRQQEALKIQKKLVASMNV